MQPSNTEVRCFKCNKTGHIARTCNEKQEKDNKSCSICKKKNHTDKDCYFRQKKTAKEETEDKVAFLAGGTKSTDTWIIDSGSTLNLTNRKNNLTNFKQIKSTIGVAK